MCTSQLRHLFLGYLRNIFLMNLTKTLLYWAIWRYVLCVMTCYFSTTKRLLFFLMKWARENLPDYVNKMLLHGGFIQLHTWPLSGDMQVSGAVGPWTDRDRSRWRGQELKGRGEIRYSDLVCSNGTKSCDQYRWGQWHIYQKSQNSLWNQSLHYPLTSYLISSRK